MVSVAKLAIGQERYYLDGATDRVDVAASVGGGIEDYYFDPGEARGRWLGATATRMGLRGSVDAESLRTLLNGRDPVSGVDLRSGSTPLKVAAFDLTFSAPKSVSVVFGLGDAETQRIVRVAHDAAVAEALGYLERSAAAIRRGRGGCAVEAIDGFIAAAFRHRSSRAGDPQLHTHVVVANLGQGSDGRFTALDGRRLYAHATTASHVYQAVLRGRLTRELRLGWTPVVNGIAEVDGVPHAVTRAFSRRRVEIEAALAERGTSGPRASEAAALATRRTKARGVVADRLAAGWRGRAADLGWSADSLRRRSLGGPQGPSESEIVVQLTGPAGLTAHASTFTRRDAIRGVCALVGSSGVCDAHNIEVLADLVLASPAIVQIASEGHEAFRTRDGRTFRGAVEESRYSTTELLATEQRILDQVERGRSAGRGTVPLPAAEQAIRGRSSLSDEQRAMVEAITRKGAAVSVVCGRAGTGKTFALAAAREAWEACAYPVVGVAVARRAARELERGAGIPSTSVAAMLDGFERGGRLRAQTVLVVDEAGMIGTRDLARLTEEVDRCAGKVVLVGDPGQLPEIAAGGAFAALVDRGHAVTLRENHRQVESWERIAVDRLRDGRSAEALALYRSHDRIRVAPDGDAARRALVRDWWSASTGDSVMIAARRADVRDLNERARELMRGAGRLGESELRVRDAAFAAGDQVVVRRNDPRLGVVNGDRAVVSRVDERRRALELDCGDRRVTVGIDFLMRRARDGGSSLVHGYAMTCHVAQGATVDRAFVLADAGLCREWGYTALTRGRYSNHLYVAERLASGREEYAPRGLEPDGDPFHRLAEALARSDAEPLALDHGRAVRPLSRGEGRGIEL